MYKFIFFHLFISNSRPHFFFPFFLLKYSTTYKQYSPPTKKYKPPTPTSPPSLPLPHPLPLLPPLPLLQERKERERKEKGEYVGHPTPSLLGQGSWLRGQKRLGEGGEGRGGEGNGRERGERGGERGKELVFFASFIFFFLS